MRALQEGQARRVAELTARVEALEKRLQEASKARESRLRKAGLPARARMAAELRDMDTDILSLTRTLAVSGADTRCQMQDDSTASLMCKSGHRCGTRAPQS